jgi:hypothetical protein
VGGGVMKDRDTDIGPLIGLLLVVLMLVIIGGA